jgi:hypothetical protein
MAIAWNTFGLLDFAVSNIVQTFIPYSLVYPAMMIPAFFAPMSVDVHALSLRQLLRTMRRERRPVTVSDLKVA